MSGVVTNTGLGNTSIAAAQIKKLSETTLLMDKHVFLKKLTRYVEKNKSIYNKVLFFL